MVKKQDSRDWSDLHPELLELVLKRLVLRDYLKCRHVCRSWRNKVYYSIKRRCQLPSLLLLPAARYLIRNHLIRHNKEPATLLDNTGNNLQQLRIPTHAWEGYCHLVQSQEGWLIFQDYIPPANSVAYSLFSIFNPLSGEKYKLPPIRYSPVTPARVRAALSSSAPDSQNFLVAVWSLDEDGAAPLLCFCRVNDKSWTRIETNKTFFKDVTIFERELYAVNAHSVTIFNLRDLKARLVVQLPKVDEHSTCKLARDPTSGEILLVIFTSTSYEVEDVHIFKLDMSDLKWIEVDSLNDRAVFVDRFGIRVISTANLDGPPKFMRGNCVFFSLYYYAYPRVQIFSLKEKTIQLVRVNFPKNSSLFLWFNLSP